LEKKMLTWDIVDKFGTLLGIAGAVVAGWQSYYLRKETNRRLQKANEPITVILRSQSEEARLNFKIKRGDLTRAEVLGIIGMLPKKPPSHERFVPPKKIMTEAFMGKLNEIRDSDSLTECVIECEDAELDQFEYFKTPITP
jgi:hypothetical protein